MKLLVKSKECLINIFGLFSISNPANSLLASFIIDFSMAVDNIGNT